MSDKIYVIGHKSPDLDSIAAAISYADLKNKLENTDKYTPARAGELNQETEHILKKYGFETPELLESGLKEKLILVDHNEASQSVKDLNSAEILGVLDHHKVDFKYPSPINFCVRPWGSTCSIIFHYRKKHGVDTSPEMAGLMLSAVLVDTVICKSPTCTKEDEKIIQELARTAGIEDWKKFGMDIFKIRSDMSSKTAEEVLRSDFKDFEFKSGKFGIGQVETVDLNEFDNRQDELSEQIEKTRQEGGYHTVVLFITDILREGSLFLVASSNEEGFEKAFETKLKDKKVYIDGIISRKKQVAPKLLEIFD